VTNTANPQEAPHGALRVEFNYSKQGNPLSRKYKDKDLNQVLAQENFVWNDKDELVAITGRVTANYVYDYRGFRVLKEAPQPPAFGTFGEGGVNPSVSKYIYLQNNQPALKINENSTDLFVYAGRDRVMRIRIDAMGQTKSEYFINDYLGSPVVVADAVTNTVNYQQYQDPFGNLESSIGVPSSNPEFRYTDKEYEEDEEYSAITSRIYDNYISNKHNLIAEDVKSAAWKRKFLG
jgi:hypothetical protein